MARLPSISARATPRKKAGSSSSSPKTSSTSRATDPRLADQQVSKAAKRAARRAQLLRQDDSDDNDHPRQPSTTQGLTPTISKSALRRRKRKIRDQAVLGHQGLDQIKDELQGLEDEDDVDQWDEADVDAQLQGVDAVSSQLTTTQRKAEANQAAGNARVGAKMRKRVLAQESLRQPHILKDLSSTTQGASTAALSPFAMIRQHAQNSLGLNAPVGVQNKSRHDGDVLMQ